MHHGRQASTVHTPHRGAAITASGDQPSATSRIIMMTKPNMRPCIASALLPCACISGTSESHTT
eukprot:1752659-Prymnesium_polylepis.1